jgi:hypothetical protein
VTEALEAHLERQPTAPRAPRGWRSVFGQARSEDVEPIDAWVAEDFERIDPEAWR